MVSTRFSAGSDDFQRRLQNCFQWLLLQVNTLCWAACNPASIPLTPVWPVQPVRTVKPVGDAECLLWANGLCLRCMSGRPLTHFYELWWFKGNCTTTVFTPRSSQRYALSPLCASVSLCPFASLSHRVINVGFIDESNSSGPTSGQKTHDCHSIHHLPPTSGIEADWQDRPGQTRESNQRL